MPRLYLDLETYNENPISGGSYRYAATVEITLFAYAIDNQPAKVWDRVNKEPMPADLKAAINDPKTVFIAHNSMFDRIQLATLHKRFIDPRNWEDTMVKAYLHGLPGKLEHLCDLFGLSKDKAKDKDGKRLVQMFCMPHDAWKIRRCTKETHPEDWARFVNYARLDAEAMRELDRLIPKRNSTKTELDLWHLDQKINDRGFGVDMKLVEAAILAVDAEQKELKKKTLEVTGGELSSTTKRDAFLLQILKQYGIELDDAKASTIESLLGDESLPVGLKELLRIRLSATTSSTAKYKKFKQVVCKDNRVRGGLQFSGAARTRRFSGRLVQPHNFPRPSMKLHEVESGIEALKAGVADIVGYDVMKLTSSALRGCIVPSQGKKLVVADLSNIEGRDQAWLANEHWKIKAFAAYDAGKGPDLYALAYSKMFGITPQSVMEDKKKGGNQRQVGKTAELACLGEETRVLTNHGIRPIRKVRKSDLLWDGIDWVTHDGIIPKGEKKVLYCHGIVATEDHKFLANRDEWVPWGELLRRGVGSDYYPVRESQEKTYDILNAGGRNRFSIVDNNDISHIVHNCGYGGGVGSFVTFALSFGLDLDALADSAYDKIDSRILGEAEWMWDWASKKKRTLGLEKKTFIVMDSFKRQWREAHPNIVTLWELLEQGAKLALANKGEKFKIGKCEFDFTGKWLFLRLPSGRYLCYPGAKVDDKGQLSFMGVNQFTKKWGKTKTYGGKLFENAAQSVARDIMLDNMPLIEQAGYEIVLSVHDELITEAPDDPSFNAEHLSSLLAHNPPWAQDIPLAAAGFESYRYRKD